MHNFLVCVLPRPKVPIQKLMVGFSFNPLLSQIGRTLHHLSVWRNSAVGKSKVTIFTVKLYKTRPIRIITIDCYGRRYRASSCQFTFYHIGLYFISSERALYSVYVRGNLSVGRFSENIVLSEHNIIGSLESLCAYI